MIDIEKILIEYKPLFGDYPTVTKVNVGFTNTIYSMNDKFILKICSDESNEENELISKLYVSSTTKELISCYYEIVEKIDAVSLYNV